MRWHFWSKYALTSGQYTLQYTMRDCRQTSPISVPLAWWRMGDESGWPLLTNKMAYSKYSMEFDGIDDYVDCGNSSGLDIYIGNNY